MQVVVKNWYKLLIAFAAMALAVIVLSFSPVNAADPNATPGVSSCSSQATCLSAIAANTYAILQRVNDLPTYLLQAGQFIINWSAPDSSSATAEMQASFTGIGNQIVTANSMQNSPANLQQLMADVLGQPVSAFNSANAIPTILSLLPNVNDLAYGTVLGIPPVTKGAPASAYSYLRNAGGLNFNHTLPNPAWQGRPQDLNYYKNYYNTIMSIQSFDSYVLSTLVADNAAGNQLTTLQNQLVSQATNPQWLASVGGEQLGMVLRQILLFQSQTYVLFTQLLQTERQLLTAQALANTLTIIVNQDKEGMLLMKAEGLRPTA